MAEIDKFQAMEILTEKQRLEAEKRKKAKKRNYIIGGSISGVLAIGLAIVYVLAAKVWLLDVDSLPYVEYEYSSIADENGEINATITGYNKDLKLPASFRIPEYVNGYKVTKIADQAFGNCKDIVHVTIPDSVVSIGNYAFSLCENLESFTFSKNIVEVGKEPFKGTKYQNDLDLHAADRVNGVGQILYSVGANLIPDNCVIVENRDSVIPTKYQNETYNVVYFGDFGSYSLWTDGLFSNNDKIVYVEVPSTLENLPKNAFKGCDKLEEVVFTETFDIVSASAFEDCINLEKVTFLSESGVTIGKNAFSNTSISDIDLSAVVKLDEGVFKDCLNLTSFVWPHTIEEIPTSCFEGCLNLAEFNYDDNELAYENITSIGKKAFSNTKLETFIVPKHVGSIPEATFENTLLETIYLYKGGYEEDIHGNNYSIGVSSIYKEAFRNCPLSSMVLLDEDMVAVTSEGEINLPFTIINMKNGNDYTFAGNDDMTKAIIPLRLKETSEYMFQDNHNLKEVIFREIREDANENYSNLKTINRGTFKNCTSLEEIHLPESVNKLGNGIFEGCTSLKEVTLPTQLKTISASTFKDCSSLAHIDLSINVNSIKREAFDGVHSLNYVYIPNNSNVLEIERNSFVNCRENENETLNVFLEVSEQTLAGVNWHDETVTPYYLGEWEMVDGVPTIKEIN